ncbi:MAG: 6-phosphofructokinase, partial [uncultured Chloroflexia bacterium]
EDWYFDWWRRRSWTESVHQGRCESGNPGWPRSRRYS